MDLKPQDILVLLKLIAIGDNAWTFGSLAEALFMSPSEIHAATQRALAVKLAIKEEKRIRPNSRNLIEFLQYGIQYIFAPKRGTINRGMPTAYAASPMASHFVADNDPPPVWPDPNGKVRGQAFSPLYRSAPKAARQDSALYELLVLVDSIRGGSAREKKIAINELKKRIR